MVKMSLCSLVERSSGVGFCSGDVSAADVSLVLVCLRLTDEAEQSRDGRWGGWTAWFTAVLWQGGDHHPQQECNKSVTALLAQRYKCSLYMMHA